MFVDRLKMPEGLDRLPNKGRAAFLYLFSCLIFVISFIFPSISLSAANNNVGKLSQPILLKGIAVLPLENITENPAASKVMTELIKKELRGKGWVLISKDGDVEDFLARRRIRNTAGITKVAVREIGKDLGVDAALVGSVNQFSESGDRLNIGITARLVSTIDGNIIWADTLSYTGRDFVGLLGLGAIISMDALSVKVAKDLINGIADQFFIRREAGLSPFEIERVDVFPNTSKGGARVSLRVKVLAVIEEPVEVKALINGNEITLSKGEDGEFEGKATAPDKEGIYPVDVIALDQIKLPVRFRAAATIIIDNTPPKIGLAVDKKVFASQRMGSVVFTPKLMSVDDIEEWSIEILDKEGKRVRGDKGYGNLPKGLIWKGETDKFSRVEDGKYAYKFAVRDVAGNEAVLSDSIRVKNKPPVINVAADENNDKILFTFNYDPGEDIKSWKLSVQDKEGKVLKIMEGDGEFPSKLEYIREQGVDVKRMVFSVTATDAAGNQFNLTQPAPSLLSKKAQSGKVGEKGQLSEDF